MNENPTSHAVIGAAIEVHRHLGPGLLESVYESALAVELSVRKLEVQRQVELPVSYKHYRLDGHFRLDLVVEDSVIVEVESVEKLQPIHEAQLLTYLRLANKRLGLLINFNTTVLRNSIRRLANGH
jgi:GxxExxY protein